MPKVDILEFLLKYFCIDSQLVIVLCRFFLINEILC